LFAGILPGRGGIRYAVIPAKVGISFPGLYDLEIPAFAGMRSGWLSGFFP
jgi:hypothetical protein